MSKYVVFGAAGHIGGLCARKLCSELDPEAVVVASHRAEGVAQLRQEFPRMRAVHADMMSAAALRNVLEEAVFIVTPVF